MPRAKKKPVAPSPAGRAKTGRRPIHAGGSEVVGLRYPVEWMDIVREVCVEERRELAQVMRMALEDFLRARGRLK